MGKSVITKDFDKKQISVSREYAAPRSLVWEYTTGGDKQAQWWGPEGWPASSAHHEFVPGGYWLYYMQGPDGTKAYGRMDYTAIDAENSWDGRDSFSDESGAPNETLPSGAVHASYEERDGKTVFTMTTSYKDVKDIETLVGMGMEEGIQSSMDNLEKLLAKLQA